MKKLAFVINVFREDGFHSGGERVFYELINRAVNDGYIVDLYCTTYLGSKNILKQRLNKITFLGHPKDFKYPKKIEKFYEEVKKLTSKENYDHVISENISPVIDIGILQGHSLIHYRKLAGNFFSRLWFSVQKHKFIKAQGKWLQTQYTKVIVPSNALKKELKQNFSIPEEKFVVLYPCVDKVDCSASVRNDDIFTFGLSSPSFSKKGGNIFLKTLAQLKKQGYNFKAKIICPKAKNNFFLKLKLFKYNLTENIEFLPHQGNMQEFYNSINAVVMPSLMETFGLVALEGMINSKPAIVSSFCGASEIIRDRENGLVFDITSNPAKNLTEKLKFLLDNKDKYSELSKNAYETALKYNWQVFCNKFFEEIQ